MADYNADTSQVAYILPEFDYFWETTYDVTNSSFPDCSVNRPSGGNPNALMGIMNHFLDYEILGILMPDEIDVGTTNSENSIETEWNLCKGLYGVGPKVFLVGLEALFTSRNARSRNCNSLTTSI